MIGLISCRPDIIISTIIYQNMFTNKYRQCYPAVFLPCAPTEIRTLVLALKGLRPGPLDDGGGV